MMERDRQEKGYTGEIMDRLQDGLSGSRSRYQALLWAVKKPPRGQDRDKKQACGKMTSLYGDEVNLKVVLEESRWTGYLWPWRSGDRLG